MKYHNPFMSSVSFLIATIVSLFSVPALASDLSQYPDADSAAIGSAILMATLAFETEGLDLDTGTVEASDIPGTTNGTDIRVAYNALRSPGAVVVPGNTQGIELAFVSGVAFDGVTAASVTDLTFSTEPVDAPFSANDTVVVRTDTGVLFKLGNASESDNSVTFNYAGL